MTVHHDKMAYGRIAALREDKTEEELAAMAQAVAEAEQEEHMREYDKMVAGELYDPSDEELVAMRTRVRKLSKEYNDTTEDDAERRQELLHEMFGSHGPFIYCEPPVRFDYGKNTHVGDCFFANFNFVVLDVAPVNIGKQCFIGPNVSPATLVHPLLPCEFRRVLQHVADLMDYEYAKPITIGDNVWLASNVTVCGGVTIGHDTVIGAGSVVTRDIPAGVFAAGNPCRVIRPLTEKDKMKLPSE